MSIFETTTQIWYTLGMAPSQGASDQDNHSIFSRESQPKPLFATGILGRGHIQDIQSFPYLIFLTRYVPPQEMKA